MIFLVAYVFLFIQPAVAALIGWLVGMVTRQSGHFFFEALSHYPETLPTDTCDSWTAHLPTKLIAAQK